MKTEKLNYHLHAELIAQQPACIRSDSRLLVFNRSDGELVDSTFRRIGDFLLSGDCLVLNDTKVLPARFFGRRSSGGKLEGLFLAENNPGVWMVCLRGARRLKTGETIYLKDKAKKDFCRAEVLDKKSEGRCLLKIDSIPDSRFPIPDSRVGHRASGIDLLERIGFPPLPPYIKRTDDLGQAAIDKVRYQTIYARHTGAVAAPTAGLHFTNKLIEQLKQDGIRLAYITLHVGTGTFRPIGAENIEEHEIHQESFSIDEKNARIINAAKENRGRVVAVGTTSVRALETAAAGSRVEAVSGTTQLFIKPGYKFRIVNAMVTNFHLPKSTLLALVAAFAGLENILTAYRHAIEQRYRFYSYGDAMLII